MVIFNSYVKLPEFLILFSQWWFSSLLYVSLRLRLSIWLWVKTCQNPGTLVNPKIANGPTNGCLSVYGLIWSNDLDDLGVSSFWEHSISSWYFFSDSMWVIPSSHDTKHHLEPQAKAFPGLDRSWWTAFFSGALIAVFKMRCDTDGLGNHPKMPRFQFSWDLSWEYHSGWDQGEIRCS